jgi:hypothetical protein
LTFRGRFQISLARARDNRSPAAAPRVPSPPWKHFILTETSPLNDTIPASAAPSAHEPAQEDPRLHADAAEAEAPPEAVEAEAPPEAAAPSSGAEPPAADAHPQAPASEHDYPDYP